jgi:hypothetical protein
VICLDSWLPLRIVILSLYRTFKATSNVTVSTGIVTAVHVITHKQIVRVGTPSSYPEQLHQVVELAVDVAAHRHRAFYFLYVRLFRQDFFRLEQHNALRKYFSWVNGNFTRTRCLFSQRVGR